MSSLTKVNLNSSVVNVGRTTPVTPGPQTASKSIPVVLATDQAPVPVEEQNKVQSEVALSLLGIPRAEVALGIFADVNTYDVNPSEWSSSPEYYVTGHGVKHLPNEAGALVETPRNSNSVLTSKRFFRYQPGRVSAATFGIKSSVSIAEYARNPVVRKYGIFDNFDGYYWETRQNGQDDNFSVVRRTQSLLKAPVSPFGIQGDTLPGADSIGNRGSVPVTQRDDYRIVGKPSNADYTSSTGYPKDRKILTDNKFLIIDKIVDDSETAYADTGTTYSTPAGGSFTTTGNFYNDLAAAINADQNTSLTAASVKAKCKRDFEYWIDFILLDAEWGGTGHVEVNLTNFINAVLPRPDVFEAAMYTTAFNLFNTSNGSAVETEISTNGVGPSDLSDAFAALVASSFANILDAYDFDPTTSATIADSFVDFSTFNGYGRRSKLDTIYSVKKHYWAYIISKYTVDGSAYEYQTDRLPAGVTTTEIEYKCQRDSGYLIEGYRDDIIGGGNGSTKYNASMYFRGDSSNGLAIYTQLEDDGTPVEVNRQDFLKNLILHDLMGATELVAHRSDIDAAAYDDSLTGDNAAVFKNGLASGFGYTRTSTVAKSQESLGKTIVSNILSQDTSALITGLRGFAGNLVTLRDGLVMVHAGVFDTALLKDKEKIFTKADDTVSQFTLTKGVVTFGQHVRYFGPTDVTEAGVSEESDVTHPNFLVNGAIYRVRKVIGPKGNTFTLEDETGAELSFSSDVTDAEVYFETVVPFIMPEAKHFYNLDGETFSYDPASYRYTSKFQDTDPGLDIDPIQVDENRELDPFPQGMVFPYMYSSDTSLASWTRSDLQNVPTMFIGFINTANTLESSEDINDLKDQMDRVNFIPEYINWIKNNVKPEYWGVYEYRIPRSRYSHDKLNGRTNDIVFSDVATDEGGTIARPGQMYAPDDVQQQYDSVYNFDFTKVSMLKVEFSWYGAVGALFLAYVPVGNGEARWVRVHHLRASNQLKISSLGNATLPITYNVYGGGDTKSYGDGEEEGGSATSRTRHGYQNFSHNLVKYGASYYIDGGDRGTVRLFSYNNDETVPVYGKQWNINTISTSVDSIYGQAVSVSDVNFYDRANDEATNGAVDPVFFMGAKVFTNDPQDQGLRVVWASGSNVYLNKTFNGTPSSITIIPDRSASVFGLETKREIFSTVERNAVRNRVQVYPTKLSTSNLGNNPVRLRMKKTPLFQSTDISPTGSFTLGSEHIVTAENLPLDVVSGSVDYLQNNESIYGWFRARVGVDNETVLARVYREANEYYVEILEGFSDTVTLKEDTFLAEGIFDQLGETALATQTTEISGLSSVVISDKAQVPIPNTGINITTIYLNGQGTGGSGGTEQLDLGGYFDYNKEYLSFPLTDQADTLYLSVDSDTPSSDPSDRVSLGITWEEQ